MGAPLGRHAAYYITILKELAHNAASRGCIKRKQAAQGEGRLHKEKAGSIMGWQMLNTEGRCYIWSI